MQSHDPDERDSRLTVPAAIALARESFDAGYRQGTEDTLDLVAEHFRSLVETNRLRVTDNDYAAAAEHIARMGGGYTQAGAAFRLGAGLAYESVIDAVEAMKAGESAVPEGGGG